MLFLYLENHHFQTQNHSIHKFQMCQNHLYHTTHFIIHYTHTLDRYIFFHYFSLFLHPWLTIKIILTTRWFKKCFCRSIGIIWSKCICRTIIYSSYTTTIGFNLVIISILIKIIGFLRILSFIFTSKIFSMSIEIIVQRILVSPSFFAAFAPCTSLVIP